MKRRGAYFQAIKEIQTIPEESNIEEIAPKEIAVEKSTKGSIREEKRKVFVQVSTYLTREQQKKLDDLAYKYSNKNGVRVDRQDILRYLIDNTSQEQVLSALITSGKSKRV